MCGILVLAPAVVGPTENLPISTLKSVERRGPDLSNSVFIDFKGATEARGFGFCSVLSHQGTEPFPQPVWIQDSKDQREQYRYLMLWNGEAYCHQGDAEISDTEFIAKSIGNSGGGVDDILGVFQSINGPFAFVLIEPEQKQIFFGRDRFGRRSLVCKLAAGLTSLECLSSLVPFDESTSEIDANGDADTQWFEVPASGIYTALLDESGYFGLENWYPWSDKHLHYWEDCSFHRACQLSESVYHPISPMDLPCDESVQGDHVTALLQLLSAAVKVRVDHSAPTCRHCAPAVNCCHARIGVLFSGGLDSAVLAALADRYVPPDQPIDLITVAFEHLTGSSHEEKRRNKGPSSQQADYTHSPRYASPACAPDRLTALSTFEELKRIAPHRLWHLVLVDVTVAELKVFRQRRIRCLLKPSQLTTLNENLAVAVWFAARGQGRLVTSKSEQGISPTLETPPYTSPAKILLVGSGADEQLAGYSRHRNTFSRDGAEALRRELELEMMRIAERNLGRDDRMIGDHGREARFPFLDEAVVSFLSALSVSEKADFSLPRGQGEKRLLRLAALQLGLSCASALPKRAMQFGTRIAKVGRNHTVHGADRTLFVDDLE